MHRYILAALSASATAVVLLAGTAAAQPGGIPLSGDLRATVHAGNVVGKDCADLFAGSTALAAADFTYSVDDTNTYLDITAVADGVEVAGVIVKGGDAYNEYKPANLGNLPWLDLHSPLVPSGKPAQISHWFACGVKDTETTTTTTTESTTTTTSAPATTTTTTSSGEAASVTTTSPSVAAAADEEDLASTGFNGGWLVVLAAALLLGGGALLLITRLRATRR